MHAERAVPAGTNFPWNGKFKKAFCPTFCTLQKVGQRSRRRAAIGCRRQHKKAAQPPIIARSAKIWCDSNRKCRRGRRKSREAAKGFNFVSGKVLFGCADSRFEKPRTSRKGNGLVLFAACKKYRKNTLGRAKSCRWQVFVRRRPPKQGELRTDVSKATMFQGDRGLRPSGLRGAIQISARYMAFAKVTGVHQVTGHAENCNLSRYRR